VRPGQPAARERTPFSRLARSCVRRGGARPYGLAAGPFVALRGRPRITKRDYARRVLRRQAFRTRVRLPPPPPTFALPASLRELRLTSQPSLACIPARATVDKPTFARL